jgi:regulator of replication initiation timing
MSTRVVDRVDEWDERPFDGYRSLHEFADEEFSGAVRAGGAELYMTKGTVIGIRHGSIDDFEGGGTAYAAPSPALPLLAVMQETNDEVRAEYYSEKTSISEVDSTLSDGGFTGYIELSDNVLSGDYYQVYHAGQSMSVGFVGTSSRLIHGDEAFETANDEVGIYQVRPADIEVIELPEVETAPDTVAGAGETTEDDGEETETAATDDETTDNETAGEETADDETDTDADAAEPEAEAAEQSEDAPVTEDDTTAEPSTKSEEAAASTAGTDNEWADDSRTEAASTQQRTETDSEPARVETATDEQSAPATQTQSARPAQSTSNASGDTGQSAGADRQSDTQQRQPAGGGTQPGGQSRERPGQSPPAARSTGTSDAEVDLETRAIPSLDPEQTADPEENGGNARADTFQRTQEQRSPAAGTAQAATQVDQQSTQGTAQTTEEPSTATSETQPQETQASTEQPDTSVDSERVDELETEIEDRDEEIDRLESELDRKTTEYEDTKSQLETVREERDELEAEVEQLEEELERLETELGAATDAERRMTPAEALTGTDIFPRYASKGDATLEKAHEGSHRREDVLGNLRLEQNTQFDADTVSVGGQAYAEFLESTLEYRFVNWVVGNLLFEIRETGHEKKLKDLYDAIPVIDWADLKGTVDVVYTEEGQETRSQESFDIVLRNRMGEPLIVANLNDSREGATESMMENLVRSAERVGQSSDAFAGAFLVTKSFFEPPALETADDATKGGLLSRNKRKSFVNLSRKNGYHLCLVEARNDNFTLLVPEL